MSTTDDILALVKNERIRQDEKWGVQNHHPLMWLSILGEEYGESCKAINEASFKGFKNFDEYRMELIQTAAVAVAAIESLDRNIQE